MRVARNFRTIMTLALLAASTVSTHAQTNWTGAISSDWFAAGNWNAGVPTAATSANINTVTPNSDGDYERGRKSPKSLRR